MKKIVIILAGDQATGKTRFGEALVELLAENGVDAINVDLRPNRNHDHCFSITSDDAFGFAKIRGK